MNGYEWKEHRRLALQLLRDLGYGKGSMEDKIVDEIGHLIAHINQTEGKPIDIHSLLVPSMSNNICQLVFGHRLDYNEPKRRSLDTYLEEESPRFSQIGLLATTPNWFSKLFLKVALRNTKEQFRMILKLFEYASFSFLR